MAPETDPLLDRLAQMEEVAPPEHLAAQVLRRGRAVLAAERDRTHPLAQAWSRALLPALLTGTVGAYLFWALQTAGALYR